MWPERPHLFRPNTRAQHTPRLTPSSSTLTFVHPFFTGTKSWEALLPGSVPSEGPGGLAALEDLAGWQVPTLEELSRNKYYRRLGEACEVRAAGEEALHASP